MSAVGNAVSNATGFLVGGKQHPSTTTIQGASPAEQQLVSGMQGDLGNLYDQSTSAYNSASNAAADPTSQFKTLLTHYLANNGNATPEQLAQATNFVDQTFTNPTQTAINQYNSVYNDQANAKAAMLGRNPNGDVATQQAIYSQGQLNQQNLMNQRAAMIQQQAQSNTQNALNSGMQGSTFLNNLTQQAFNNRLNALNGMSNLGSYYLNSRVHNTTSYGPSTSSGLMTNMTAIGGGLNNLTNTWSGSSQLNNALSPLSSVMGSSGGGGGGSGGGLGSLAGMAAMMM